MYELSAMPLLLAMLMGVYSGEYDVFKRLLESEFDLSAMNCTGGWDRSGTPVGGATVTVSESTAGMYVCRERGDYFYLLPLVKNLTAGHEGDLVEREGCVAFGEKVKVVCSVGYYASGERVKSTLEVYDLRENDSVSSLAREERTSRDSLTELRVEHEERVTNRGRKTYLCRWSFVVSREDAVAADWSSREVHLQVCWPVSKVDLAKTNLKVDELAVCTADGYPPPDSFRWSCDPNSSWIAERDTVRFLGEGRYRCTCEAENEYNDTRFSSSWTGEISVGPDEVSDDVANAIVNVLGITTILVIAACFVYVVFKFYNSWKLGRTSQISFVGSKGKGNQPPQAHV